MKKIFAILASMIMILPLFACQGNAANYEANSFEQSEAGGNLGMFSLTAPNAEARLETVPTFSWTASSNATYYTLEIASTETFIANDSTVVYYKHDYISTTSYEILSNLAQRDVTYWWKVTAHVGAKSLQCNNIFKFFLSSVDLGEVNFALGEASDWSIHSQGNPVALSVDNTNFFANSQDSLVIKFEKENTKGIGWSVITKTVEKDTYGDDAIYLRFFYSGDDASAYLRLIDNDGEFWRHEIKLANNSKQICILPFSEFEQNTELVTVSNYHFDYFHIKYMEIVFERTWGDGVALVSEVKAIKKSAYSSLFIDKLNFNDYPTANWAWENDYNFGNDISADGSTYTLKYDQAANELNTVGMASKGYGFAKIPVNRFFAEGDTVKMSVKYSGSSGGNVSFRLKEEDGDYWYYMQSFSTLSSSEYTTIYAPFKAFAATYLGGNGKREFAFILQLQFGLTNMYGSGTLSFKDVAIVTKAEQSDIDSSARVVGNNGIIENFDTYTTPAQPFYQWGLSVNNKDEFIALDSVKKSGYNNVYCGKFTYKADMEAAKYTLPLSVQKSDATALSLWIKDASVKSTNTKFNYLDSAPADIYVGLTLTTGALYYYEIKTPSTLWTEYTIPFSAFSLYSTSKDETAITSAGIASFSLSFQYFYFDQDGTQDPTYMMANPVYIDNIALLASGSTTMVATAKEKAIAPDAGDATSATIETAESYTSTADVLSVWGYGNSNSDNALELANEVSSEGGAHSLKMNYKSYTSVSYAYPTTIANSVSTTMKPKGILVDLKGDDKATVYITFYVSVSGSDYYIRRTLPSLSSSWTRYAIGFDTFETKSVQTFTLAASNICNVYKITFGAVNSDYSASAFYADNLRLSNAITRSTYTASVLA